MRRLAGKELTHRALDELPAGKTVEHLRSVLVTRRLRARLGGSHATHNQVVAAQRHIKAAVAYMRCRIPALPSA